MHALGDQVPPALEHHLPRRREVDADVRAVELLLDDQRLVGDEAVGLGLAQVLVVVRPLRAEQMRRPRVLDELAVGTTHDPTLTPKLCL